jgi:hypothetical protein
MEMECPCCKEGRLIIVSELSRTETDQILICCTCDYTCEAIYTTYVGEMNS